MHSLGAANVLRRAHLVWACTGPGTRLWWRVRHSRSFKCPPCIDLPQQLGGFALQERAVAPTFHGQASYTTLAREAQTEAPVGKDQVQPAAFVEVKGVAGVTLLDARQQRRTILDLAADLPGGGERADAFHQQYRWFSHARGNQFRRIG